MDFEKLTNQAKQVLNDSQQILQRYSHTQLDAEHLLLALLEQEGGVTTRILDITGIDADHLVREVERDLGKRPQVSGGGASQGQIYITPQTQRVFDAAWAFGSECRNASGLGKAV